MRASSDRYLVNEPSQPEVAVSTDLVHIISSKELHSRHDSRQQVRESLENINQQSPAASHGRQSPASLERAANPSLGSGGTGPAGEALSPAKKAVLSVQQ